MVVIYKFKGSTQTHYSGFVFLNIIKNAFWRMTFLQKMFLNLYRTGLVRDQLLLKTDSYSKYLHNIIINT